MIYHFKIISPEVDNFSIELETGGEETFFALHEAIQKAAGFYSHQLASFFISNGRGKKEIEISLLDNGFNGFPYYAMQKTRIADLISANTKRLLYTFDFFNDRSLIIELTGIDMEKNQHGPLTTFVEGEAPVQILEDEENAQESTAKQEDEVFNDFGVLEDYTEIFGEMDPI